MKKFRVIDIAEAIGRSESAIRAAASARGWSARDGLGINEILEINKMPKHNVNKRVPDGKQIAAIRLLIEVLEEENDETDE